MASVGVSCMIFYKCKLGMGLFSAAVLVLGSHIQSRLNAVMNEVVFIFVTLMTGKVPPPSSRALCVVSTLSLCDLTS